MRFERELVSCGGSSATPPSSSTGRILIACGDQAELVVVNADGEREQRLRRVAEGDAQWAPDAKRIAFHAGGLPDLKVVDADGSDPHLLLEGEVSNFVWAPGSDAIAAVRTDFINVRRSLYVVRFAPKARRVLVARGASVGEYFASLSSSQNARRIIFADTSPRQRSSNMRVVSRELEALGEAFGSPLSPDGAHIAFVDDRGRSVHVMRADGTEKRQIAIVPAEWEAGGIVWSPKGDKLVYTESSLVNRGTDPDPLDDEYVHRLTVTHLTGGSPIRIDIDVRPGGAHSAWSPDGKKIAFLGREGGLFVRTIGGGTEELAACGGDGVWNVFDWRV